MQDIRFLMPEKVGYFCILLFIHVFLCNIKILDATAFSNFNLDTNWGTYLCANENPIVDEKTVILTATGLPSNSLPCLGLRKNMKISGEYQMSSQLINVGPPNGERNFGLAFNAKDEYNYDFVYLSYDIANSCTKMAYGYVEKESLTLSSTKSACMNIQPHKWNFLKITVKDDCDHCNNVDGYVNGHRVFSFEAHFATRGFGGALAENGFSNVVEFREFDIGPIIPTAAPITTTTNTPPTTPTRTTPENDPSKCLEDWGNGFVPDNDCIDCDKPPKQKCADGYIMNSSLIYDPPSQCTKITCTKPDVCPDGWTRIEETCFSPPRKTYEYTTSVDCETNCGPIEKLCTDAGAKLATKDETLKWLARGGDPLGMPFGLTSTRIGINYWFIGYGPGWYQGCCHHTNRFFVCAK